MAKATLSSMNFFSAFNIFNFKIFFNTNIFHSFFIHFIFLWLLPNFIFTISIPFNLLSYFPEYSRRIYKTSSIYAQTSMKCFIFNSATKKNLKGTWIVKYKPYNDKIHVYLSGTKWHWDGTLLVFFLLESTHCNLYLAFSSFFFLFCIDKWRENIIFVPGYLLWNGYSICIFGWKSFTN